MNTVKFSVFSDFHSEPFWYHNPEKRLEVILNRAKEEKVDFIMDLGDFGSTKHNRDLIEKYTNLEVPTYHVLGNHDLDSDTLEETVKLFKMPHEYYYFDKNGFRFVVLNENYCRIDGVDIPYECGNYYKTPQSRDYISKEQVLWLEEVIMSSPYPIVVASHNSLEIEEIAFGAVKNREDVQNIFRKAYANGKRIFLCLSGHHHRDYMRVYEHICYFAVNSTSMCVLPKPHNLYPKELVDKHHLIGSSIIYNDPVHAVITLSEDGTIDIKGMKSSFFMGISSEMAIGAACEYGRKCTPDVLTEKIKIF